MVLPEGHDLQLLELDRYWYVLRAHNSHEVEPVRDANLPVGQDLQARLPVAPYLPVGHAVEMQSYDDDEPV